MNSDSRNNFSLGDYSLVPITESDIANIPDNFSTENDLNEFFTQDALMYENNLYAKTYKFVFVHKPELILGLVSLLNDSLKLDSKSQQKRETHRLKMWMNNYPAVKIGRLAINSNFSGHGLGTTLINLVKRFFLENNRTGCRFITVDAYNKEPVLKFYQKHCSFELINSSGKQSQNSNENESTVSMFFNLSKLLIDEV